MHSFIFILFAFIFSACSLEEIQPTHDKQLIIAQNLMRSDQLQILQKMAKRKRIQLIIKKLSAQQIRKQIEQNPWNPGFDLILLDGIFEQAVIERLPFQYKEPQFAIIPLGVSFVPDSIVKVKHFKDLSTKYLWAPTDNNVKAVLKLHLANAYRKRNTQKKVKQAYLDLLRGFKDHELQFDTYQLQNTLLLCRLDTHLHSLKKEVKRRQFTFALHAPKAYYADYIGLYIVEQCSNYHLAKQFVKYLHYHQDHEAAFRNAFGCVKKSNKQNHTPIKELLKNRDKWHLCDIKSWRVR